MNKKSITEIICSIIYWTVILLIIRSFSKNFAMEMLPFAFGVHIGKFSILSRLDQFLD